MKSKVFIPNLRLVTVYKFISLYYKIQMFTNTAATLKCTRYVTTKL